MPNILFDIYMLTGSHPAYCPWYESTQRVFPQSLQAQQGKKKQRWGDMVQVVNEDVKLSPFPTGRSWDDSIDSLGCLPFSLIGIVISI